MARGLCKLCELEDFADASLRTLIRSAYAGPAEHDSTFPDGREYRKLWEVAMSLRAFRALGLLGTGKFLGIGAGAEPTLFWLTSRSRCVVATDLYDEEAWGGQAPATMLTNPGLHATCPWDPRRLVVKRMDARVLQFADASFDGVFSASAIEHFGDYDDVRQALTEMRRVLRPGGIATISTEYRLDGPGPGLPGSLMFDHSELLSTLGVTALWQLVEQIDLTISERTLQTIVDFDEAVADVKALRDWSTYPHIVLRHSSGVTWTSVHVVLRRAGF